MASPHHKIFCGAPISQELWFSRGITLRVPNKVISSIPDWQGRKATHAAAVMPIQPFILCALA